MLAKLIIAATVGALVGAAVVAAAAPELNLRGGRFKPLTYAELSADQKAYVDREIAAGRTPGPGGPSNINLRSPEMADLERPVTEYLRFKSPMQRKLKEIAVMLTARFWGGQYVWYSHRQQALDAGLAPAFISAMAAGERPADMSGDEAAVYDFATELLQTRQVSDANFKNMVDRFGERGVVETDRSHGPLPYAHDAVRGRPLSGAPRRAGRDQGTEVVARSFFSLAVALPVWARGRGGVATNPPAAGLETSSTSSYRKPGCPRAAGALASGAIIGLPQRPRGAAAGLAYSASRRPSSAPLPHHHGTAATNNMKRSSRQTDARRKFIRSRSK